MHMPLTGGLPWIADSQTVRLDGGPDAFTADADTDIRNLVPRYSAGFGRVVSHRRAAPAYHGGEHQTSRKEAGARSVSESYSGS